MSWVFIGGLYAGFVVVRAMQHQKTMREWGVGCGKGPTFIELCVLVTLFVGGFLIVEHAQRSRLWAMVWWLAVMVLDYALWWFFGEPIGWCGVL
ncbi:MAG: hypothetical protein D6798_19120 [Deltaproteobacteria bacterium]|nr:MAG: hypothetical protein D6798_19120 [Deltaproteobacteria bacterium]